MKIDVKLSSKEDKYIINNLYPLYLHDLSEHYGFLPNKHGVYEESNDIKTLEEQIRVFDIWWEKPNSLFPYLIYVDDIPAGFLMIASNEYVPVEGIEYYLNESFLVRPFRGQGISEKAVKLVLDKYRGNWMLTTDPNEKNKCGQKFWRRTLNNYTNGNVEEYLGESFDGYKLIFKFNNKVDQCTK